MAFNLTVPPDLTTYLNAQAHAEAQKRIQVYALDLLREAGRLETASSTADADPQITSTMVADADLLLRRGYRQPPRSYLLTVGKIISPVGALVTGILATAMWADADKLREASWLIAFVILLVITVIATVLVVVKE